MKNIFFSTAIGGSSGILYLFLVSVIEIRLILEISLVAKVKSVN